MAKLVIVSLADRVAIAHWETYVMKTRVIARDDRCRMGRRTLLQGAAALGISSSLSCGAFAAAPALKAGDISVTSLSDGHLRLPTSFAAPSADPAQRAAALAKVGQTGDTLTSQLNVTLIKTPTDTILIDTGSGSRFMDTAGKLADALDAHGVAPDDVTKVVFTHAHPDHCWGTLDDFDELTFSNAEHVVSEMEWNYWMSPSTLAAMPDDRKAFAVGAKRQLSAAKDQIRTIKPGADIVTGVCVLDTAGHTPGHISLEVGTGNTRVVILGDALTHPIISFEHPDWAAGGDQDSPKAVATRKALLSKFASEGQRVIGYHFPRPGFGRVVKRGNGFAFEKVES